MLIDITDNGDNNLVTIVYSNDYLYKIRHDAAFFPTLDTLYKYNTFQLKELIKYLSNESEE